MNKLCIFALVIALTGCASGYRVADTSEVNNIPDDCGNRKLMINWLEGQLEYKKPYTETQKEFDAKTSAIKSKIWHLRYRCQPV
jgi:hypothetical protein